MSTSATKVRTLAAKGGGLGRRATASVELALVAMPVLTLIFGLAEVCFDLYAQIALDYAVNASARLIATGSLQGQATSLATFKSAAFCPALSGLLPCGSISINVVPVSTFFSATQRSPPTKNGSFDPSGFAYCPGQPSQLISAQAIYPAPSLILRLLPVGLSSYGGQKVMLISSTAGFVNEPFTSTAPAPAGC